MSLRLSLSQGNQTLWELTLDPSEWAEPEKDLFQNGITGLERDIDMLCDICSFYSNKRRFQMVNHIVSECGNKASFTDLLRVAVNPKYVTDLVNKASKNGLVVKDSHMYRVSQTGIGSFLLLSIAVRKLLHEVDSISNRNKSFEGVKV